ncbi:MAG: recombinase family protein [Christensenellales bacterium]
MNYGYVRVSTRDQNIDRQMAEMYKNGLSDNQIFIDKQSGKDFDRTNYQKMKSILKYGDLLIIKSIDRLGRNYDMIIEEWKDIVNHLNVDIVVLDMPLLDTRTEGKNLVGKFISDIVLQILSFVAENERENIKKRQAEGIRLAKEKGKHLGRPKYSLPTNFYEIISEYKTKHISLSESLQILKMNKSTFYKYLRIIHE